MKKMVLFAIGPDRPGLVSDISGVIHGAGGNLEDSRMATLSGDFALLVLFSAPEEKLVAIEAGCRALQERLSITTHLKEASAPLTKEKGPVHAFTATGHDQPGIVRRLTQVLAAHGANVVSMDTSLVHLAFHGTPMFKVKGRLSFAPDSDMRALRHQLEDVCEDMELLLEFEPY